MYLCCILTIAISLFRDNHRTPDTMSVGCLSQWVTGIPENNTKIRTQLVDGIVISLIILLTLPQCQWFFC